MLGDTSPGPARGAPPGPLGRRPPAFVADEEPLDLSHQPTV